MSTQPISAFLAPREQINYVFGEEREQAIYRRTRPVQPCAIVEPDAFQQDGSLLTDVEVVFSTWGMPALTEGQIDEYLPNLRAIFYAAGSVQRFARPFLERGVRIVSAWRANGISVAQYTTAQIVLSTKGYFRNLREYDGSKEAAVSAFRGRGVYGEVIGLLGVGAIGKMVIEMLRNFDFRILIWDPFLSETDACALGVEKVNELGDVFERSYVVSNHLADKDEIAGLIDATVLSLMRPDATFINTGRGRTVNECDLVALLAARPDLTALLDVTHPEPPGKESPLMRLPNSYVTSHIAGTVNDEVRRMADLCIRELDRYIAGQPLEHEVVPEILAKMA